MQGVGLDRRKSHDGHTRLKLNAALTALFCARVGEADLSIDLAVDHLHAIHGRMARRFPTGSRRTA